MNKDLLACVLLDWTRRVVADLERSGIAPCPWNLRQTLAAVFALLWKLDGTGEVPPDSEED